MKRPEIREAILLDAAPAAVYEVLRDYGEHHPRILPKPEFEALRVERGGVGAGTLIQVDMRVMGQSSTLRMRVDEPEPGRVLTETDDANGVVTTFTVTPVDGGGCRVEIHTLWTPRPGVKGWIEALIQPRVARKLYRRELALLRDYVTP